MLLIIKTRSDKYFVLDHLPLSNFIDIDSEAEKIYLQLAVKYNFKYRKTLKKNCESMTTFSVLPCDCIRYILTFHHRVSPRQFPSLTDYYGRFHDGRVYLMYVNLVTDIWTFDLITQANSIQLKFVQFDPSVTLSAGMNYVTQQMNVFLKNWERAQLFFTRLPQIAHHLTDISLVYNHSSAEPLFQLFADSAFYARNVHSVTFEFEDAQFAIKSNFHHLSSQELDRVSVQLFKQIPQILPQITTITCTGTFGDPSPVLDHISDHKHLKHLAIRSVKPKTLSQFQNLKLSSLKCSNLFWSRADSDHDKFLHILTTLNVRELRLKGFELTPTAIQNLRSNSFIEKLLVNSEY